MTASQLFLRPLTEDDIPTIFSLTSDPEVARFMRFSTHKSIQEAEDLYREYTSPGNYGYMICLKDDLTPVGVAALKKEENEEYTRSMSVYLYPRFWNRGYSTEVILHLKEAAVREGIKCLKAYVVQDNTGSCRVLEKHRFSLEEVLHFPDLPSGLCIYTLSVCKKRPEQSAPDVFHIFKSTVFFSPTLSGKPHFPSYRHSERRIHNRTHSRPCQS